MEEAHPLKETSLFEKNQPLKREIYGFQCLAGLGDLLLKKEFKEPQIVLAPEKELKELICFLNLKSAPFFCLPDLSTSSFETKEISLTRKAFHLGAARGLKAVFCSTPFQLLKKVLSQNPVILKEGEKLPNLTELGFHKKEFALNPGEFAMRGYLCDVFPPSYETALRLELEGERILSLHTLNKDLKSRKEKINKIFLMNLKEWNLENRQSLCLFLKNKGPREGKLKILARGEVPPGWEDLMNVLSARCSLDFFSSAEIWIKDSEDLKSSFYQESLLKVQKLSPSLSREDIFLPWEKLKKFPSASLFSKVLPNPHNNKPPSFSYPCYRFQKSRSKNMEENLKALSASQIVFISQTAKEEERLKKQLLLLNSNKELSFFEGKLLFFLQGRAISFINERESVAYIQTRDLLPIRRGEETKQKSSFDSFWQKAGALDFSRLEKGELIVHRKHGVGQFLELQNLSIKGISQDYFVLGYKDGDKLLLPAYKAMEIKKYAEQSLSFNEKLLDRLGDPRKWEKKKETAKKHIQAVALELLSLYRARKNLTRPPFEPVSDLLEQFSQTFPFKETPGQCQALSEIFKDMESSHPMERLLTADVGFGKTEVALRTAFRAMANGFQVCFLVPTTILSLQHYENFKKRLKDFPFELATLNRFLTPSERKELLKKIKKGMVDLIITTHGVFNPEVSFKNLGLLIIDEEHRFGVRQKEYLRRVKRNLDTLSLSATPIPRTLSMALSGMKDISAIPDPPLTRKSVKIFTTEWNPSLIKRACEMEKNRGGQILFVHNKIQSIYKKEEELKHLLPHFKIAVAHGKIKSMELEKVILSFFEKKFDLLLSTNIIESGMDIPEANTLFIDKAHEMGLSRIYQLKGRVGRGEKQAYCYFLTPSKISPTAEKRLELLEKYSHLGGGLHLALHDLESRGAGELFGAEQSGHLNNLGQELFFELLREKLEDREVLLEPEIQLPVSTGIPASYIPDKPLRLLYYKSLSEAKTWQELQDLCLEIEKAMGAFPPEMSHLFGLLEIRLLCKKLLLKSLKATQSNLYLTFHEKTYISREQILSLIKNNQWKMRGEFSLAVTLSNQTDVFTQIKTLLDDFL